jgi:hypothetical protein
VGFVVARDSPNLQIAAFGLKGVVGPTKEECCNSLFSQCFIFYLTGDYRIVPLQRSLEQTGLLWYFITIIYWDYKERINNGYIPGEPGSEEVGRLGILKVDD